MHVNFGVYTQLQEQPSSVTVDMFYRRYMWQEYESVSLIAWKEGLLWRALWKASITEKHQSFFLAYSIVGLPFLKQHSLSFKVEFYFLFFLFLSQKDSITHLWAGKCLSSCLSILRVHMWELTAHYMSIIKEFPASKEI